MSRIVLLDGGMGQELLKRSSMPPSPLWSAQVMMDEPEIVEAVHLDYIRAGARVLTLNTYSATPERLARDAEESLFEPLQQKAIGVARAARDKSSEDVAIAGCLPPLFASYRPDVVPEYEATLATYRRIVGVEADHVDCFLCETLSSIKEIRAATTAAKESGKPVWTSMTVQDGDGLHLRSGEATEDGVAAAVEAGADAVLVNCSWPESVGEAMPVLKQSGLPFGGYANGFTGIEALQPGGTVSELKARSDLGPDQYAAHVMDWVEAGATIVGGCCEVGPAHIRRLAETLVENGHDIAGTLDG